MKQCIWKTLIFSLLFVFDLHVFAQDLEPPKLQIVDRNNVNMASGKLNIKQTDLSIGSKEFALTHTISNYGNRFLGYAENHRGNVYFSQRKEFGPMQTLVNMMTVVTGEETIEFDIAANGTYVSRKDKLSTLERVGNNYIFTSANGTEIKFVCETTAVNSNAVMVEKKFPNGFTITTNYKANVNSSPILSIATNTGLQFKYRYVDVNDGNADSLSWSRQYPQSISAVNNAVEYCTPTAADCAFANTWPTVTYTWPAGLPGSVRTSYKFNEKIVKVTDPIGGVTEYYLNAFDMYEGLGTDSPGPDFEPAVTKIKNSKGTIEYRYKNYFGTSTNDSGVAVSTKKIVTQPVTLYEVLRNGVSWSYGFESFPYGYYVNNRVNHSCTGYDCVKLIGLNLENGGLTFITTDDQNIVFDLDITNHVSTVTYNEKNYTKYEYDARGHINKITEYPKPGSNMAPLVREANYDDSCTNPKTCNQPNWVSDAMGQRTNYTYHPESGQVATVTKPAATDGGIRPQTRYTYTQKYAWYKNSSGAYVRASSPIWLRATEGFCRTSASTTSGCSVAGDEVLTTYDYGPDSGPNNLFLRGIVVTADGETRRTCYSYDNLGNRIGETLPKANLTSCP